MAGLYAILGPASRMRAAAAAERLQCFSYETTELITTPELSIAWVSQDPADHFAPALHPETGVRVITSGRVAWDEPDWQRAEKMGQYQGGWSNRLLLDRYLSGGIEAIEHYNGSAIVIVYDPRVQKIHLLTDQFGFHPAFIYRSHIINGCIISTFPDAIADDAEVVTTPDRVSMAEFLCEWKTTPPHTYYNEIKYAGAATHCTWDLSQQTYQTRIHWNSLEAEFAPNLNTAVDQLTEAVKNAIRIRTLPRFGRSATYISGGMDSRVIPFAAADPTQMIGINLFDVPNREAAIARQICETAGIQYVACPREEEYYTRYLRQGVEISGARWSAEDNHFLGTLDLLRSHNVQTVLAAFPIDDLFKGAALESQYVQWFGRNLPFFEFSDQRVPGFIMEATQRPLPPAYATEIQARMDAWFAGVPDRLVTDHDRRRVEHLRNRPYCYQPGVSDTSLFRITPYDIFLADPAIAQCYSQTRPAWKINATLWSRVVARICGTEIVDSSRNWRPGASNVEKFSVFAKDWVGRRLKPKQSKQGPATDGSWSNLGWYALHSSTLKEMWESVPECDRALITELWGSDPWQVPLHEWATPAKLTRYGEVHGNSPYALFRILTLLNYLSLRRNTVGLMQI